MTEDEWHDRFITAFEAAAGVEINMTEAEARAYADDVWRAYYNECRDTMSPEECVELDLSNWGEE